MLSLTSDYDYRGFSQTAEDLALQGSLGYRHDSGLYATAWGSSLDWGQAIDADIEIDYYLGFRREFGDSGISWDVGYLASTYPGASSFNYDEFYGGFSWDTFSLRLYYSSDFGGVGQSAWYLEGGYSYKWDSGWSVLVNGGYSFGNAFEVIEPFGIIPFGNPDYWNYGAGVGYTYSHLYLELKVVGTDLRDPYKIDSGVFANQLRGIFSVTLSLP